MDDERNFQPVAVIDPGRTFATEEARCDSYALSFFATRIGAIERYKYLLSRFKMFYKRVGTHLAKGAIKPEHGAATMPDKATSHFSLFEAVGVDFVDIFNIVEPLYNHVGT